MKIVKLLHLLPHELTVKYRGRIYDMMTPALIVRGSRVWLSYVGHKKELILAERLDDDEEIEFFIRKYAEELKGVEVYETKKLF